MAASDWRERQAIFLGMSFAFLISGPYCPVFGTRVLNGMAWLTGTHF
jgi:hypothetical protein